MRKTEVLWAISNPALGRWVSALVAAVLLVPGAVFGQEFSEAATETTGNLQFSFSNPGARSLAMGGAFAGLADDATAAYVNPAGLTQLSRPEVSVETRDWSYSTLFTERGRTSGEVTYRGIDVVDGLKTGESTRRFSRPSFVSFIYPRDRWTIAVYRHQLVKFGAETRSQGLFVGDGGYRLGGRWSTLDLEMVGYGLSSSFNLVRDRFSLGASLVYYDISMASRTRVFAAPDRGFDDEDFTPAAEYYAQHQHADKSGSGVNAGFLWRLDERWSLGGFYRQGPEFELEMYLIAGPEAARRGEGEEGEVLPQGRKPLRVPDVWGLGASYRPTDNLVLMFEYDLVRYSQFFGGTEEVPDHGRYVQEDGEELRLGIEYTLWHLKIAPTFRFGLWLDPDHKVRFEQEGASISAQYLGALFPAGKDELHVTGGLGFVFGQRLQLDAAFDLSDRVNTFSASLVARF